MSLIETISSTLKTSVFNRIQGWVFKRKLLRFSGRFRWEAEACFYCPEMCRFSCPVAETLRNNTVTPRGKMSLLHLAERGYGDEQIAGGAENRLWFLEQCSGCGRCTEFCVYENDVASQLRQARAGHFDRKAMQLPRDGSDPIAGLLDLAAFARLLEQLRALEGIVLLCEPGRKGWWEARPQLLEDLGVSSVCEAILPHREWAWGKLGATQAQAVGEALAECSQVWVESPEAAWFLARAVKDEHEALGAEVRVVWQRFFGELAGRELAPGVSFHESWHLSRHFPRLGYSIPMYERGLLPFHNAWNVLDCGGEGFFRLAHPATARSMGGRFLRDLVKDGRMLERIVCQSLSCVDHLRSLTDVPVVYWLDELFGEVKSG